MNRAFLDFRVFIFLNTYQELGFSESMENNLFFRVRNVLK
jgi:hypothetical protein